MAKVDPYNHKRLFERWKENPNNPNLSKSNNKIILDYMLDLEAGRNISRHSPKGSRSYIRLNKHRQKVSFILELLEKHFKVTDIHKATEDNVHDLFAHMRNGKITKLNGGVYKSTGDYVKNFKAFWHWLVRVQAKEGKVLSDITGELDTKTEDPTFNYFTEEQLNDLMREADEDMKVVMLFMYDTGIRVTEMVNVKVSDFLNDYKELNIRNETAKTFGRRIKLMMCSDVIKNYVKLMDLKPENYLFSLDVKVMNNRLNYYGKRVLKVNNLTLYDFRHSSACYWYPRYPNVQGLLYRFGWKKLDMAHYYSRFLGMEDTVTEESLLLGVTKTELERELAKVKKELKNQEQTTRTFVEWTQTANNWLRILAQQQIQNKDMPKEAKEMLKELMRDSEEVNRITIT